ncbi:OmpL47-type beta-barrel domain-containing protein [Flindersiella endophytica]
MTFPSIRRCVPRGLLVAGVVAALLSAGGPVTAASFGTPAATYTAGGVSAGGAYYAKSGSSLILTVNTSADTKCVEVAGLPMQTSTAGKTSWTFEVPTEPSSVADGVQTKPVSIGESNNKNNCAVRTATTTASYVLDNTGPTVTAEVAPAPNAVGWNRSDATVSWTADDGTGVGSGTVSGNTTVTADTAGRLVSGYATDALGNRGATATTLVKKDSAAPIIGGTRTPAANAHGWNNTDVEVAFTCSDTLSMLKSCVAADAAPAASRTLTGDGANQSVGGTATDNAGNTSTAAVGGVNIDQTAPDVTASARTADHAAYTAGMWTNQTVTVTFDCADALSGMDGCTGPQTLDGEGVNQQAIGSGADRAGNSSTAEFSGVNIDLTAPNTTATAPETAWNNTDVTVQLGGHDALSGLAATHYRVDGGAVQTGDSAGFSAEGSYELSYWSTDRAGNQEQPKTVTVHIDRTPPAITHALTPAANPNGWNDSDVTVTFDCGDTGGSGVASCGPNRTVTSEGKDQAVPGTATDNAGNTATDPATVSVDKTAPEVSASVSSAAEKNANGWYNEDVTVSFACSDELSGIDNCPAPKSLGEGANQSAKGTAADAAGNQTGAELSGINVDKTSPVLVGTPSTTGWSNGDVTVDWTCTDTGSGPAAQPAGSVVSGEGANLSASATCTDRAGNAVTESVTGIRIDRSAPSTHAVVDAPAESRWYADGVDVTLSASDWLSGVGETYYRIDDGSVRTYDGGFRFSEGGKHTLTFWSTDRAGNAEATDGNSLVLWVDDARPGIVGSSSPAPNAYGWNNTPVSVSFSCSDTQSGVAQCTDPVDVTGEGAGQKVTGTVVDGVGKSWSMTVDGINLDFTAPVVDGVPTTDPRAGWYNGDVTIHWVGSDGLSGIEPGSVPADSVLTGEGGDLGAGPVTVRDHAGNVSEPASIGGVRIDRHGPAISGGPTTQPNAAGWYRDEVVVDFTCTDPALADGTTGSGVAACPTGKVLKASAAGQSVTSDPASDLAGNTTPGKQIGGIDIDGLAPSTSANNQCTKTNGYCTGSTANVVLSATDQSGLSGVKEIHYAIDGGQEKVASGAAVTVAVPLDGSGAGTVTYWAVDRAGNAESPNAVALRWDNIAPAVTHTVTPNQNADEWNNTDVTVRFSAKDDDAGSGLDESSLTPDVVVDAETAGQLVRGHAKDLAGNEGTDSVTVRLDKTKPVISGSITHGLLGSNGWYTGPVTVHFTCSDPAAAGGATGSGLPAGTCPEDVTLTANRAGQSVTRTIADRAGNLGSVTVSGIDIDQEPPAIVSASVRDGAVYDAPPALSCTASDEVSGVDSCDVQAVKTANAGEYAFTVTAKDKAGNVTRVTGAYRVKLYTFGGFGQPINDPAVNPTLPMSTFKTGSTVPVKFQLRDSAGNLVQARTAPQWIVPVRGSLTTASVNESPLTADATTDGTFRWDPTAQQYIYNWQTKGLQAGYNYKLGVKLDDGFTYSVTVGLR